MQTIHLLQHDGGPPKCVPLPDDWFMNVAFNYIKFASYSAVPFVVVLTLNVAVIYRTLRVSPNLRRTFGGELTVRGRGNSTWQRGTAIEATAVHVCGAFELCGEL